MRLVKRRSRKARFSTSSRSRRAKLIARPAALVALATLWISVPGCIALIGRPTIEEGQDDVVGEVARVDLSSRRIYLRPNKSDRRVVAFSTDAQVLYRGREYPVARLGPGDLVAMQVKRDSRGDLYADLIRIQENSASQSRRDVPSSAPRIETVAGRVESINRRDNSFELDDQSGPPVLVRLSSPIGIASELCGRAPMSGSKVNSLRAIALKC